MSTPDVVPVAWHIGPNAAQVTRDMPFSSFDDKKSHVDLMGEYGHQITPLHPQATIDVLQARIDGLEKDAAIKVQSVSTLDPLNVARLSELISAYKYAGGVAAHRQRARREIVNFFTAHDAALRARIDELEAQLFIARANAALPLFDAMGLEPLPAFPSIRP